MRGEDGCGSGIRGWLQSFIFLLLFLFILKGSFKN